MTFASSHNAPMCVGGEGVAQEDDPSVACVGQIRLQLCCTHAWREPHAEAA